MVRAIVAAFSLMAPAYAAAQEASVPPPFSVQEFSQGQSRLNAPARYLRLGPLDVRLDQTTLQTVAAAVGVGSIAHRGDAGDSEYWLCYTSSRPMPHRVWLISNAEMGGPEHRITQLQAVATSAAPSSEHCPALPSRYEQASLAGTPLLGRSVVAWRSKLGAPSFADAGTLAYVHSGKVVLNPNGTPVVFDRMNELRLFVRDGLVIGAIASQVTSH